jgi:hypothetical protein
MGFNWHLKGYKQNILEITEEVIGGKKNNREMKNGMMKIVGEP